ncbi:MAG: hypothetical protein FJ284_13575 [Planctomycetes bacterium]|nr:hypothetical protein [Planctomycetota bacterium]MBM4023239.1 hypothetical protein [Planctomycetota bacterium]
MESQAVVGLLKFFGKDEYLASLARGLVYFTPPESYRIDGHEGRGDPQESCSATFRMQDGGFPLQMKFGDQELQVTALTAHNPGRKPGRLNCWFAIGLPTDFEELERLVNDVNQMRATFGSRYVFLHRDHIEVFASHVRANAPSESANALDHGLVEYSARQSEWGVFCKPAGYAYQREYRFVLGECGHMERAAQKVQCPADVQHILHVEPTIQIYAQTEKELLLVLDKTGCRIVLNEVLSEKRTAD